MATLSTAKNQGPIGGTCPLVGLCFANFQYRGHDQVLPALFRTILGSCQRDYFTSAKQDVLQGVKDPRGPVGINAMLEGGPRCRQPPLWGPTKQMLLILFEIPHRLPPTMGPQ
jgi:hypothetical protein